MIESTSQYPKLSDWSMPQCAGYQDRNSFSSINDKNSHIKIFQRNFYGIENVKHDGTCYILKEGIQQYIYIHIQQKMLEFLFFGTLIF